MGGSSMVELATDLTVREVARFEQRDKALAEGGK